MKKYSFASAEYRDNVKLTKYKKLIEDTVHKYAPNVKVIVEEDCYKVDDSLTKGDAIRIGRELAHSKLGQYCVQRPVLFKSTVVDPELIK